MSGNARPWNIRKVRELSEDHSPASPPVPEDCILDGAMAQARAGDPICLIHESPAEEVQAAVAFFRAGLDQGQSCLVSFRGESLEMLGRRPPMVDLLGELLSCYRDLILQGQRKA